MTESTIIRRFVPVLLLLIGSTSCQEASAPSPTPAPAIFIGDGSKMTATAILDAGWNLGETDPVKIEFLNAQGRSSALWLRRYEPTRLNEFSERADFIPVNRIDHFVAQLTKSGFVINDGPVDESGLAERFERFSKASAMVGATSPIILLFAEDEVPGTDLVRLFQIASENGIDAFDVTGPPAVL